MVRKSQRPEGSEAKVGNLIQPEKRNFVGKVTPYTDMRKLSPLEFLVRVSFGLTSAL